MSIALLAATTPRRSDSIGVCNKVQKVLLTTWKLPWNTKTKGGIAFRFLATTDQRCHLSSSSYRNTTTTTSKTSTTTNTKTDLLQDNRIPQICMHPNGIGQRILPGGYVMDEKGKKRNVELALGYFWMMKDLSATGNKPILANETLIPEREAALFPTLFDLTTVSNNKKVLVPDYFVQNNQASSRCSLVTVAFKQYGNIQAATWTSPFEKAFANQSSVHVYSILITEGTLFKMFLSSLVIRGTRQQTPPEKHDRTLLYFGNPDLFRDVLRMHNTLAGYVFLLDRNNRVRFAASGEASAEDVDRLISFANILIQTETSP